MLCNQRYLNFDPNDTWGFMIMTRTCSLTIHLTGVVFEFSKVQKLLSKKNTFGSCSCGTLHIAMHVQKPMGVCVCVGNKGS